MFLLFSNKNHCQTINLDNIEVSIGDSLEYVIKKFTQPQYHISIDTLKNYLCYNIYKESGSASNNTSIPVRTIGHLYFTYYLPELPIRYTKDLFQINKVWNGDNTNNIQSFLKILGNILEINEFDKYSTSLSYSKKIEPEYSASTISMTINPFTSVDIYYHDDGYFEISEVITKDENSFSDEEYILIFEDTEHLIGKKTHIMEIFKKEDDAEYRFRELTIPYLMKGLEIPNNDIIRFYKNRFRKKL
jgi:hypothetical protein